MSQQVGPYRILGLLGSGGMGEVYRAHDPKIDREVAIKILPADVADNSDRLIRFEREARAAGALNHPNLVTVHDVGRDGGSPYLVMELLEGETLRSRLQRSPGTHPSSTSTSGSHLPTRKVIDYGAQIAHGLAAAHERGIVHRDLKPENIFLTSDGRLKIVDFGLAKLRDGEESGRPDDATVAKATDPGSVIGTASYMAPEQVRGADVDHRADIFAFGVVLYEMLTGQQPFERETRAETMTAILREEAEDPRTLNPAVPVRLARIVSRCLEKNREERFQSARDLAFDLGSISEIESGVGPLPITRSALRRPALIGVGLAILAFVAGVVAGLFLRGDKAVRHDPPEIRPITYSGLDFSPSVSPDGRLIAFVSAREGSTGIWLKHLEAGTERPLTAGQSDFAPSFSPDGAYVLFSRGIFPDQSIWRISVLGGEARRLLDGALEGRWSPDGSKIAVIRPPKEGATTIALANGDGTEPVDLLTVPGKTLLGIRWSPDGTRLLATDAATGNAERVLVMIDVAKRTARDVRTGNSLVTSAEWIDDRQILLADMDRATFSAGGGTRLIVQGLGDDEQGQIIDRVAGTVFGMAVREDGSILFDLQAGKQNLKLIPEGDEQRSEWLTRGIAIDRQPVFSPDGKEVLFSSNMSGNLDLWAISLVDRSLRRVTDDLADDFDPAYLPDGSILWSSRRGGHYEIWTARRDGTSPRQVTSDGFDAENAMPAADGWIIYNSYNPAKRGLWKVRLDGSKSERIIQGQTSLPEVSPDGRFVSYHDLDANELRVLRIGDGEVSSLWKLLGSNVAIAIGRSRWMPDGKRIVYRDADEAGIYGLFIQEVDFGSPLAGRTRARFAGFDRVSPAESFAIGPDGTTLVLSGLEPLWAIHLTSPIPEIVSP